VKRLLAAVILIASACSGGGIRVVVAAGTTLVDSGLIDALAAEYEATRPGVELSVVGEATAQVLALARNGAADVTITHAPDLEAAFEAEGLAKATRVVFSSRFILAGPAAQAAPFSGLSAAEAFQRIATEGIVFVSRADGSGTHLVEQDIWAGLGLDPHGAPWYLETGQGMGLTLQVASERGGFTLSELGTFLAALPNLSLVDVGLSVDGLRNPYKAMAVSGSPVEAEAVAFVEWLASPEGRAAVERIDDALYERAVFEPVQEQPMETG